MEDYIIAEEYTLPSKGKVYSKPVNPNIKIRSMTTEEEMKRLGYSELPYKMLSEIIDDCLIEKPGISSYDMCLGDYQFLLHKLRIVTYGPEYVVETICPHCNKTNKIKIDLNSLEVQEYTEDIEDKLNITLPRTKKHIKLRMQTPRILDDIFIKTKNLQKKSSSMKGDPAFLFTLESLIETVDGEVLDAVKLESFVRALPAIDSNYILKSIMKINLGVDININCNCHYCKEDYVKIMPFTNEFFGPSID